MNILFCLFLSHNQKNKPFPRDNKSIIKTSLAVDTTFIWGILPESKPYVFRNKKVTEV